MKRILILIAVLVLIIGGIFLLMKTDKNAESPAPEENITTYSSSDLGLEFKYPRGENGYVLNDMVPFEKTANYLRVIVLMRSEDVKNGMPVGGEGPPTITISVFRNLKKQFPLAWANENTQYSNINLKNGEVGQDVVGGANAIRYMADGLYASENVVVAHGENIYVMTGMFLDQESAVRKDFSPLVLSVRFIPQEFGFNFPENLPTKYIHALDWPPMAEVTEGEFSCIEAGKPEERAGRTERRTIGGREYCVTEVREGAAGSVYSQYTYMTEIEDKIVFLRFTTQATQCENYSEPQRSECKAERESFNIDQVVDQIVRTGRLSE
mgnify:FL=1